MGYSSPVPAGYEGYIPTADILINHPAEETTTTLWVQKAEFELISELSPSSILRFKVDIDAVDPGQACQTWWKMNGTSWFYLADSAGGYVTVSTDKTRAWTRGDRITVEAVSNLGTGKIKNIKICGLRSPFLEV